MLISGNKERVLNVPYYKIFKKKPAAGRRRRDLTANIVDMLTLRNI
jgi:hypothetical protein